MNKKSFVRGAAILGIAGILVQVMGAIFRIPLANIIGDQGMGYYQTVYPIYVLLLIFSTNGAPTAISKMVSERLALGKLKEAHRVFKLSFILMLVIGVLGFLVFFYGAKQIVAALGNPGAYYAMIAISPALLFVPLMSVYRGYFQGHQSMGPTAVSQLAEQAIRVAAGMAFAVLLLDKGLTYAAAGATIGTSVGPIAGVIILVIIYYRRREGLHERLRSSRHEPMESAGSILAKLASIAVPVTVGVSIMPIMNLVDVTIIMRRLQYAGFTHQEANALYGQLSGMAGPVINIPMALALSVALSLVPAIAAANSVKDHNFLDANIRLGFRAAMIIGIPCTFGLMSLAGPIMQLFYPMQAHSASNAAPCLFILSTGIIFLSLAQTMVGILQGLGRPYIAVVSLGTGVLVNAVLTYVLTGIQSLNVQGAAIATVVGLIVVGIMNFGLVKATSGTRFDLRLSVVRPLISGIVMTVFVLAVYYSLRPVIGNSLATAFSILVGGSVYVIMLFKTKSIAVSELILLPKGDKLTGLLQKMKLI